MQAVVDNFYAAQGAQYYEETGTSVHGYTNQSFPSVADENAYLTVTYYDNYNSANAWGPNYAYTQDFAASQKMDLVKGLVTSTKTKVLNTNIWLKAAAYYDNKYRPIQTRRDLYDGSNGGSETASTLYDFAGKVMQSKLSQTFDTKPTTVEKWYTYDHAGRLLKTEQQINGVGRTTLSEMAYNELGQLQQKKLGGVQAVDYQYNIRGWLTQINDPDNLGTDLFGMKLLYNDPNTSLGNSSQFNGNISGMIWNSSQKSKQGYLFSYDAINRLTGSNYKTAASGSWTDSPAFEEKSLSYDANGNITQLIRTGETGNETANYTYHYSGNQLTDISSGTAYTYDKNGNTTKDGVRGFDISYNQLNLPKTISKGSDNLSYIYSASGEKLAKQVNGVTNQYYAGSMVYNDTRELDYLLHEEGMVKKLGSSFTYEYYLKDHLGNNRVVFTPGSSTPEQVTEYYPFGMSYQNNGLGVNKYLYNGKELQDETIGGTSLGMYDYGARFYDPQIARWHVIDPMIEKHHDYTPYAYVYNNPLRFIDPVGLDSSFYKANGDLICKETGDKGKTDNNYVVKTTETTDEMYGEASYRGKGKTNPITEEEAKNTEDEINNGNLAGDHMKNLVKLKSSKVMGKMINSVKDDGSGGESDANNREYGGNFSNNGVKDLTQGATGDPSVGQPASVSSTNGLNFHSHASGGKHFMLNGQRKLGQWRQPPSIMDINSANGKEYVIGMRSGIIYIYNRTGVTATIPINVFKK